MAKVLSGRPTKFFALLRPGLREVNPFAQHNARVHSPLQNNRHVAMAAHAGFCGERIKAFHFFGSKANRYRPSRIGMNCHGVRAL